jgi:hypothetical protein
MKRENIEQVIRELFRQNYSLYPDSYSDTPSAAIKSAKTVALGYWDNRTDEEIERDEQAEVTDQDYENWVVSELVNLKKESVN